MKAYILVLSLVVRFTWPFARSTKVKCVHGTNAILLIVKVASHIYEARQGIISQVDLYICRHMWHCNNFKDTSVTELLDILFNRDKLFSFILEVL